jgi:hypothetical protein
MLESERRQLLLRLDSEPEGWRRCALAFLEAQTWRDVLRPVAPTNEAARGTLSRGPRGACFSKTQPSELDHRRIKPQPTFSTIRLAAVAAGLLAAFATGWGLHNGVVKHVAETSRDGRKTFVTAPDSQASEQARFDVAAVKPEPPEPPKPGVPLLDPLIKKWEQKGFRAERQERLVSMEFRDGRRVKVPIQELRVEYIGGRTY